MAGVAEFTMGFGLLWTALIRRLSALTLFVIFNAAVYPFGRLDLVGHALIMAVIVAIFADPTPQVRFAIRRPLWTIPASLVAAMMVFSGSYWGLHAMLYGPGGQASAVAAQPSTHSPDPQRPHGGGAAAAGAANPHTGHATRVNDDHRSAYAASMARMHGDMEAGMTVPDADLAFVKSMIPHHQGAIDMARIQLQYGSDPENRKLAEHIIAEQESELAAMKEWLRRRGS
jgi:hypothetical protein